MAPTIPHCMLLYEAECLPVGWGYYKRYGILTHSTKPARPEKLVSGLCLDYSYVSCVPPL